MPDEPPVSVVIPAYNAEKTIRNALRSVLEQTMSDLEVMAVDDASTDATVEVIQAVRDPRVRLVRSPSTSGCAAARNLGLARARGRWVAFLDADDEWVPKRLENLLLAAAGDPNCFVADRRAVCVPGTGGRLVPLRAPRPWDGFSVQNFDFLAYLRLGEDIKPMVPRELTMRRGIGFPSWSSGGEWAFFMARLSASGIPGKLLHRVGYLYRVTGAHFSSTLGAIEVQLQVTQLLAHDREVPEAAKEWLEGESKGIRRRLLVAALREGKWGKFAHYALEHPNDLVGLPASALRFASRWIQYSAASHLGEPLESAATSVPK